MNEQKTLFDSGKPEIIDCQRCGARCRVSGQPGKKARMLRFAQGPGLCVNCAVHDWLRNTSPPNILLAQSGPKALLFPHIQNQFIEIMKIGFADAKPDEIDWNRIVENWELPFPNKIKTTASNPCSQKRLDAIKSGNREGLVRRLPPEETPLGKNPSITSFAQLNKLKPGLGDELRKCLRAE